MRRTPTHPPIGNRCAAGRVRHGHSRPRGHILMRRAGDPGAVRAAARVAARPRPLADRPRSAEVGAEPGIPVRRQ